MEVSSVVDVLGALLGALIGGGIALFGISLAHRRQVAQEINLLIWQEATELVNLLREGRHAALKARRRGVTELTEGEKEEYWLTDLGIFLLPGVAAFEEELLEAIRATRRLLEGVGSDEAEWQKLNDDQRSAGRSFEAAIRAFLGEDTRSERNGGFS